MSKIAARNGPGRTRGRVESVTRRDCSETAGHGRRRRSRTRRSAGFAQPNAVVVRLRHVIATRLLHPDRRLLLELLLRGLAAALSALVILGLLPAITQAAA